MLQNLIRTSGFLFIFWLTLFARVSAQCDASFSVVQAACTSDTVVFTSTGTNILSSSWDFGDGFSDTGLSSIHIYSDTGSFPIRHITINPGGCHDTAWDTIQVYQKAALQFYTDANCSDDQVSLFGVKTSYGSDVTGPILWHTGTGDSLLGDTVTYTYPSSGYYSLRLSVSGQGCNSVLDSTVFIKQRPQTQFTNSSDLCKNDTVQFNHTGTAYSPVYSWNFGDVFSGNANTDSVANPRHRFSNSGSFQVRLVVSDTMGCRDTLIQSIHISQSAAADISYSNGCLGLSTLFSQSGSIDASDSIISYRWFFGDGDSSQTALPTHAYADTGIYTVRLIIGTRDGCIDTSDKSTHIYPKPLISLSLDSVCRGLNVDYQITNATSDINSYLWSFGDGFTATSASPAHQYNSAGNYYTTLKTTFLDGKSCTSSPDSVRVLPLPGANFIIDNDTQCYKGNQVCVHFTNQSSNTLRRRVLFDDGYVDVSNGPSDTFVCYSYSDPLGGAYYIAVQMLDSNGCSQSISSDTAVLIHPEFDTEFTQSVSDGCFTTIVNFSNGSNQNPPDVVDFYWDFGDGTYDSSNWSSVNHSYTNNGTFSVMLWAENADGCRDSTFGSSSITNINYSVDAVIDSLRSTCASTNRVYAHQSPIPGASIQWVWQSSDTGAAFTTAFSYEFPGTYHPYVHISLNGCDSIKYLDTVEISGPYARIGTITNRYQCQVSDTVYAFNSTDFTGNAMRGTLWDFGDPYAASCTTNYLAGVNPTGNCRYTTDTFSTKHMYDLNHEGCYYLRLIVYDTINGCSDTTTESVSLAPPVASPDTANSLNGLFTIQTQTCLGPEEDKEISISLTQTQPICGRQTYWVMWDSACAVASGNFNGQWRALEENHNYDYDNAPCDPNGYVTIGLIVQNGDDSLGNICRDTAYYHNILHFNFMDPRFGSSYDSSQYYCKGSTFDFYLLAQNQDSVNRVVWNWGDGTLTDINSTDTVQHTFNVSGSYQIINTIYTTDGCFGSDTMLVNIGTTAALSFSESNLCIGDSFQILPQIFYLNDGINYWADSNRIAANKEALFFNLDDGNGFQNLGTQPWIENDEIKNYLISVAYRDSLSCWDTVNYQDSVRVFGVYAEFSTSLDTFLCPQAISFTDFSSIYDSTAMTSQSDDSLVSWVWTFGSGLANSNLQHPERYLSTGAYSVQLKITNTTGCTDSVSHPLVIVGPMANYVIQTDSAGCEPLRVYFKNESTNASNYVWQFNDSSNAVLSTTADSAFYFDYELYGNFVAKLTAQGSFNQNGITVSCEAVFPDSTAWDSLRLVVVHETPNAGFTNTSDCANGSASFTNTSTTDNNSTLSFLWEFGDGDTSSQEHPTHFYSDTGHYFVILHTYSEHGCEDTSGLEVIIAPQPEAWFSYNEACLGTTTLFEDSTEAFNDLIYDWQWNFGDGAVSTLENPFHDYQSDSSYTVSLIVTNIGGCMDTVTRNIRIHSIPVANFSVAAVCQYDSARINDLSTNSELPLSYSWDLADGLSSTQAEPVTKYNSPGSKFIIQIVSSPYGCKDTTYGAASIRAVPSASFAINDSTQCAGEQNIVFSDGSSISLGTYTRIWDFGDGNSDTASTTTNSYAAHGTYTVELLLSSNFGCYDTAWHAVEVYPQSETGFMVNTLIQCEFGNAFSFTDTSTIPYGSITRSWLAGDGNSSTDSIYNHSYADTGSFTVQLIQLSAEGCRDTVAQSIYINPSPRANFVISDSTQCLTGNQFDFTNSTNLANGSFVSDWTFGDGNTASGTNVSHSYSMDSSWTVRLIVTSDSGCRDTMEHQSITYPMPDALFGSSDTALCYSDHQFDFYDSSSIKSGTLSQRWYFGDGDSSSLQNPSHSYPAEGVYSVQLLIQSNFGCGDTVQSSLEVFPMPDAQIYASDTALCFRDHEIDLIDSSTLVYGSMTREWNFGDGNTDTTLQVQHSYTQDSTWQLALRVTSNRGCSDSAFQSIYIYPQAEAQFIVNDSDQCHSINQFDFTNQSTVRNGTLSYSWNFGDTNSDSSTTPSHSYLMHGTYAVQLISNTLYNCADTTLDTLIVYPNPEAIIGIDDSLLCFRNHVFNLQDSSTLAYGTWTREWDFGDISNDTAAVVSHQYALDSTYQVALRITSQYGCLDSAFRNYTVYPQANSQFTVNDSDQCHSDQLFILSNQSDVRTGSLSYLWDFGDGNSDTATQVNHQYLVHGNYTIQLVAITRFACNDTLTQDIIVYPNPEAFIGIYDSSLCYRDHAFTFDDSTSLAYGWHTRVWDFGDGQTDTSAMVSHTYTTYGVYATSLQVISEYGCKDSAFRTYEVYPQAHADFSINDTLQCYNGHQFTFANLSTLAQGNLSYLWDFGDGRSDTAMNTAHQYGIFGDYTVSLISTTIHDCADTISKNLRIDPNPLARIWLNDSFQCINAQSFDLADSSTLAEGVYVRQWVLGDGDSSVLSAFTHPYLNPGLYTIALYLESDKGCLDSSKLDIEVFPKPFPAFSVNDTDQCLNTNDFRFSNTSTLSKGSLSYHWSFGDGNTDTTTSPAYTYQYSDTMRVVLLATSSDGCIDSAGSDMIVFPKPIASWTINDTAQCVNTNDFQFNAQVQLSSGNIKNYFWDLENRRDSGDLDTARTYLFAGSYPVLFYVQTDMNCWDTLSNTLTIHPKPQALFSVNDSDQCINTQNFLLDNQSNISAGNLTYKWMLGDGDSSTDFEPIHYYLQHDSVTVILYAESDLGCFDTTEHQVIIFPKPEVYFSVNDTDQCVNGNRFVFTNQSSIPYGSLLHEWKFGDGQSSLNKDNIIVYATQNTYQVDLKVTSNQGCSDSFTNTMIVYPKPNPGFSINDEGQCVNTQDFQFTDQSSIDYGNLHYIYRFGTLGEDTMPNSSFHFSPFGKYIVRQVLISDYGCSDSLDQNIRVFAKPDAFYNVNDSTQCVNYQEFQFSQRSFVDEGKVIAYHWDFDDGNTTTGNFVTHFYDNPGYYQVSHFVQTDSNCWDTIQKEIRVYPKPVSSIGYNDSAQCLSTNLYEGFSTSFDSTGIDWYYWNIGTDSIARDSAFTYHFSDTGLKTLTLRIRSIDGCYDTSQRQLFIKPMPDPGFSGLKNYHCNSEGPTQLIPITPGGIFSGQNVIDPQYLPTILWSDTIHYWVEVNGCADSSYQVTQVYPFPEIVLGDDTTLCKNEFLQYDLSFWQSQYYANGEEVTSQFRINEPGYYHVSVSNICGTANDSIQVDYLDDLCRIYLPNAFTPNKDELHPLFYPVNFDLEVMDYIIYNRWGQIMYKGNINSEGWDGTFNGKEVEQDVYVVQVYYEYHLHGEKISGTLSGNITLLR